MTKILFLVFLSFVSFFPVSSYANPGVVHDWAAKGTGVDLLKIKIQAHYRPMPGRTIEFQDRIKCIKDEVSGAQQCTAKILIDTDAGDQDTLEFVYQVFDLKHALFGGSVNVIVRTKSLTQNDKPLPFYEEVFTHTHKQNYNPKGPYIETKFEY